MTLKANRILVLPVFVWAFVTIIFPCAAQPVSAVMPNNVPVGTVIAVFLSPFEVGHLAPVWIPADGRVLHDNGSRFDNVQLPALSDAYIKGADATDDVTTNAPSLKGGSTVLKVDGDTTGVVADSVQGRVGTVSLPYFVVDTTVDETQSATHHHHFSQTFNDVEPPYQKLVYLIKVR